MFLTRQRLGKPVEGGGVHALGRENRAIDKRKVRPINQRHPVEQKEFLHHADRVTRPGGISSNIYSHVLSGTASTRQSVGVRGPLTRPARGLEEPR